VNGLTFAAYDTKRFKTNLDTVNAQVAFLGNAFFVIEFNNAVRAGIQTGLTSVAYFFKQNDDSTVRFCNCFQRAGICTRRLFTMIAKGWQKMHAYIRKSADRRILEGRILGLNPDPTRLTVVFFPAGNGTSLTTDASFLIND
jgi:hypothetical protein